MSKEKILVVDDEESIRKMIKKSLDRVNYEDLGSYEYNYISLHRIYE